MSQPQIYLASAQGWAVRPLCPVDVCEFLHAGAAATLAGLAEIARVVRVAEP